MIKYYAMIEGYRFVVKFGGRKTLSGFCTTFYFEGDFEYKNEVVELIALKLNSRISKSEIDFLHSESSFFIIKDFCILEEFPVESERVEDGFSFFKMTKIDFIASTILFNCKNILFKLKLLDYLKRPILLS